MTLRGLNGRLDRLLRAAGPAAPEPGSSLWLRVLQMFSSAAANHGMPRAAAELREAADLLRPYVKAGDPHVEDHCDRQVSATHAWWEHVCYPDAAEDVPCPFDGEADRLRRVFRLDGREAP